LKRDFAVTCCCCCPSLIRNDRDASRPEGRRAGRPPVSDRARMARRKVRAVTALASSCLCQQRPFFGYLLWPSSKVTRLQAAAFDVGLRSLVSGDSRRRARDEQNQGLSA